MNAQLLTADDIRLETIYQGLETHIRNSRLNQTLGKLVDVAQAENQRSREAFWEDRMRVVRSDRGWTGKFGATNLCS